MKCSFFTKVFPYKAQPGQLILYSTKKTSLVILNEETFSAIGKETLPAQKESVLAGLGMVVPDLEQEKREMKGLLERINEGNSLLRFSVYINLACNFNCIYCYEGKLKGQHFMSEEAASQLVRFIKDRTTPDKTSVEIAFYGGEPLLSRNLIKSISKELKSFAEERGIKYAFSLVTNGSLFTREVAQELLPYGLNGIKVTMDGPPDIHNRSRPFRNGGGSFDVILRNMKDTADLVGIRIGGNFQKDNYERFPALIDILEREGLTPDRVQTLKFDPAMNSPMHEKMSMEYMDGLSSINEPWLIDASFLLREEVLRRGYHTPKLRPSPCQVELKNAYVVNYDGVLYKCPTFVGNTQYAVGDIWQGLKDYSETYRIGSWKKSECDECEYYPLCFGGCRYMSYVQNGNLKNVDCKKSFIEASLERLLHQDIKYSRTKEKMK